MPKLIFTGEHFAGRVYELTLEKTTVGRGDHNTLALHDPSVSLAHCEILVHGPEVIVRDLGSANGTFVNGVRLDRQQCQMKAGQTVRFGSVQARLDLGTPTWEDTASEETAVFAARRIVRDQDRDEKNPKPASASATFDSGTDSAPVDQTVLLPRTSPTEQRATALVPQKSEVPTRTPWMAILIAVALALGLVFLFWRIWGRK
jgi:pSer/pThr/pTyr-binding forkhead associated (FHA) protein